MKNTLTDGSTQKDNPFLSSERETLGKKISEAKKNPVSKEELLRRAQELKSKAKK